MAKSNSKSKNAAFITKAATLNISTGKQKDHGQCPLCEHKLVGIGLVLIARRAAAKANEEQSFSM